MEWTRAEKAKYCERLQFNFIRYGNPFKMLVQTAQRELTWWDRQNKLYKYTWYTLKNRSLQCGTVAQ